MEWDTSDIPNPQDPATFAASKLDWSELEQPLHAELLAFTTRLLEIRRTYPDFTDPRFDQGRSISDDEAGWLLIQRGEIVMVINFSDQPTEVGLDSSLESVITVGKTELSAEVVRLGPHSALVGRESEPGPR